MCGRAKVGLKPWERDERQELPLAASAPAGTPAGGQKPRSFRQIFGDVRIVKSYCCYFQKDLAPVQNELTLYKA